MIAASRTDTERAVLVSGAERDAEVRKAWRGPEGFRERLVDPVLQGRPFSSEDRRGRTTARGADGTSECPGDSSHERGASAIVTDPGTSSRPTNPFRVRNAGGSRVRGPGPVQRLNTLNRATAGVPLLSKRHFRIARFAPNKNLRRPQTCEIVS